ncbi:hypothetical protein [Anaerorhabdus furcosa]|uniref:Uncharacterized protein n=1 Tax=Anaerorhabdus furcosa TaxID=118967 RepID=A0A1T4JVN2_9FIRM|nr:hypothetical protein [Anaerorhabdus furcosa]SJZ34218.1 hypothetical protein SAMN02745191_0117 [Anaerorhabdus furcosa]
MKEILQEYGGFILSIVLIGALILNLKNGFIGKINENITAQLDKIAEIGD